MNNEPANLAARMREPAAAPVRPTSMALHPAAFGGCIVACLLASSACGSGSAQSAAVPVTAAPASPACPSGSAFALSLVSDRGGQPAPAAAAAWFARHGGVAGVPARGWREASRHGRPLPGSPGTAAWPASLPGAGERPAAMTAARQSDLARSHSTSSRDPTGHGKSTAATGVPDSCGTPVQRSGRQCVHPARADPDRGYRPLAGRPAGQAR